MHSMLAIRSKISLAARKAAILALLLFAVTTLSAQAIPVPMQYSMLYEFVDELITDGVVNRQTIVRPFTRTQIAAILTEAASRDSLLDKRQQQELDFYLTEFALERDTLPDYKFYGLENPTQWRREAGDVLAKGKSSVSKADFNLSFIDPSFHLKTADNNFKLAIFPLLGMDLDYNKKGLMRHQYVGAEIQMDIVHHISLWGSLRDHSYYGQRLDNGAYLINRPGLQYKEATNTSGGHVGDYSDMRGGIAAYAWWGRIAVERECVRWGDAYHSSNILSGHNPAVPMISLQLTPCPWLQFDYFHAWLVSNVQDSTRYYLEHTTSGKNDYEYRPANKFMAANMLTFIPCKYVSFSIGNSIVYAEKNVQAAYFIPVAFFKSLDHLLTKGIASENQNSQVFASLTVRPTDHLKLYGSFFLDEFSASRLKKSNKQNNPISYLVGFDWSGWPVRGLSLKGEFMRSYIACYTHSIDVLTYESNSYKMGHYMGDNAQSIYLALSYRPLRGLRFSLDYTRDTKYNVYQYLRDGRTDDGQRIREGGITETISQKPFKNPTFNNDIIGLHVQYELSQRIYAHADVVYNNARAYETPASHDCLYGNNDVPCASEVRGDYLNMFCPAFYQGKNVTISCGLSFGF